MKLIYIDKEYDVEGTELYRGFLIAWATVDNLIVSVVKCPKGSEVIRTAHPTLRIGPANIDCLIEHSYIGKPTTLVSDIGIADVA